MKRTYSLLLSASLLFSPSIPQEVQTTNSDVQEQLTPEQLAAYKTFVIETFEPLMAEVSKYVDQLYGSLSTISAMIMGGQVLTIQDKKGTHTKIKNLNLMVNQLRKTSMMVADPGIVVQLTKITKALVVHVRSAMRNNMKTIGDFNPMSAVKNIQESDFDPANIQKELKSLGIMIRRLEKETETIGLTWYNKCYRALDKAVIAPCEKYGLHKWVPVAYASAVVLYWLLAGTRQSTGFDRENKQYIFDEPSTFEKPTWWIPSALQKFMGPLPNARPTGSEEALHIGRWGHLETIYTLCKTGHFQLSAAALALSWSKISHTWSRQLSPWIDKNLTYAHNFLKGGAYLKEAARMLETTEEIYFSDIVGLDHVKETFTKIVHYLENPEYYARQGLVPPKGILLEGDTRTGKSYSVKALFNEIKQMYQRKGVQDPFRYVIINGSMINMNGGFEQLMTYVRYYAPCVIFIDEIDLLDLQRKGQNQMLSEFLTSLSGALNNDDPKKQVIVIAATNNPESLDRALRAAGRLGHILRYELPSNADRVAFIKNQIEKLSLDTSSFNIEQLAYQTEGKSYEALKSVINTALLNACIQGRVLEQQDLVDSLDKELRNIITIDNRVIPDEQLLIVASHFAGPALFLHLNNGDTKLSKVTTHQVMSKIEEKLMGAHLYWTDEKKSHEEKRFEYGGLFTHTMHDTTNILSYAQKRAQCMIYLSGFIAEETLLGASGYSCHKEYMDYAMAIARSIAFEGLDADKLPDDIRTEYHRKALRILEECKNELRTLFKEHRSDLEAVRAALLEKEALSGEDVTALFQIDVQAPVIPAITAAI